MKNVLILLFMLLMSFFAQAKSTWRHDHDLCKVQNETLDLDLHSHEQYSVSADDEYGEIIFLKYKDSSLRIDLRQNGFGRFRMIKLYNSLCSKIALVQDKEELNFFFLKDNRPLSEQIVVLHFNTKTSDYKITYTDLSGKNFFLNENRLYFQSLPLDPEVKTGTVNIDGLKYSFIERPFEAWFSYDGHGTKFEPKVTWDKFEYKNFLRKSVVRKLGNVTKATYRVAYNPFLKKKCFSLNGEAWKCH